MTLATGAWYVAVAAASTAVVWKGSGLLDGASERLAGHYGLPPIVRGAIVAAVGSSAPELSSTVLATSLHGQFDLGVGAIVGSAVFNVLVIPAASALSRRDDLPASRTLVYKEAQFYMLAVSVLLLTFAFAVIYRPAGGDGRLLGTVTRPLALVPVSLYGLYVFIQFQDVSEYDGTPETGVDAWRQWLALVAGLALIVIAVEGLVRAAIGFGDLLGTPSFVWGLIVVAAGTSVPDLFVSLRAANGSDGGVTSLANVLGSNTFDLLVAVPAGVLVAGSATVDFAAAVPMMACLTVATLVLFTLLRTDLSLTAREAYTLLAAYAAFVGWVVLEAVGTVGLLPID